MVLVDAAEVDTVEAVVSGVCPDVVFQPPPDIDESGAPGRSAEASGRFCKIDIRHVRRIERSVLWRSLGEAGIWLGNDGAMLTIAPLGFGIAWSIVEALSP